MDADGPGTGRAEVVVGDQREGGGKVEGLADPHEGAGPEEGVIGGHMTGDPGDDRPGEEASGDGPTAAETVGNESGEGAEEGVDPFELPEHAAPVGVGSDVLNIRHDGELHGGQHLAVEVVEESYRREQSDNEPRGARSGLGSGEHAARFTGPPGSFKAAGKHPCRMRPPV